ncbi:MAG: M23 family metallopeptidase [Bacteroidetes bacterium]|nr:MAG: M23 family metallopeptidase [Bacteroidota bacterium]
MEKKKRLINRLRNKYRLVIMNESTLEEKASLTLSKLNVFIVASSLVVFFTGMLIVIFAYTPLKEYIPGCVDRDQSRLLIDLAMKADSLEYVIHANDLKLRNDLNILRDRPDTSSADFNSLDSASAASQLDPSERELALREEVKPEEDYALRGKSRNASPALAPFFTPLDGMVSAKFDPLIDHLATDIVSKSDQTVRAVLDGTVVFCDWTSETGHVIAIQHSNNLLSIYKHNSVLLKKVGNFVDAGEAISIVGNSGESSTGPHLHFELWHNGTALNAEDYIVFK